MNNIEKAKKEVVQDFKSKFVKEQNIFECTEDKPIIIPSNDNPPSKVIPWLESIKQSLLDIQKENELTEKEYKELLKESLDYIEGSGSRITTDKPIIIPSNDNPPTYPLRIFSMISVSQRKVIPWLESLVETLIKQTEERVREEVKERLYKLEKMAGDVNPNPKSFSDGVRNGYTKGLKFAVEYLKN